ncbi:MAG: UDP-2,3-diacylglucosamine diphosphatase [Cycloclasticus sp.]|nr:MAG: UDP-2,3-diacylglucosamine diphosphatase [Cycloclasticus sp.]
MTQHVHFISDLHLTKDRPDITQRFLAYLTSLDTHVSDVYILGDLFDVWVGDDDVTEPNEAVKSALKNTVSKGINVSFIAGNRDFLIGQQFFADTGIFCLEDTHIIDLFGTPTLLMHGDLLCTDDVEYQQFRQLTHTTAWQDDMLSKPLTERLAIAQHYRNESVKNKAEKSMDIMDVCQETVASNMQQYNVTQLIHGHTHRPNVHSFDLDGKPATRIVLAEWDNDGSVLDWCEEGYQITRLP